LTKGAPAIPPPAKLLAKLRRAEDEIQRLKLRYEARPVPYYRVIKEFFPTQKFQSFVDPNHECSCNICGKDLETIKSTAIEQALKEHALKEQQAKLAEKPSTTQTGALPGAPSGLP
jgi:hypothetical protein